MHTNCSGVASKNDLQNTFLCKHCNLLPNGFTRGIFSPSLDIEMTREPANSGNLKKKIGNSKEEQNIAKTLNSII